MALAVVLIAPNVTGCVESNAPAPEPVAEATPLPVSETSVVVSPTPSPARAAITVTATAAITAGGGIAKSDAVSVFASIGETGAPSIQNNGSLIKVSGIGAAVFAGTFSD